MPLSETTSSFEKQTTPAAAEQNQVLESLRRESDDLAPKVVPVIKRQLPNLLSQLS